jgi:hypothetical protein
MAKRKKEIVWIVVGRYGAYIGFWYTKKDAIQGHIDDLGYMKWKQAYDKGDRVIKAILRYDIPNFKIN